MNSNTGTVYPSKEAAFADLGPTETHADIVEIVGTEAAVQSISRAIQQARAVEKRRAANKAARKSRQRNRPTR